MHLSRRDTLATGLVALAAVLSVLRATEVTSSTSGGVRATGAAVLLLGFIASAAAVVPSFTELMHGNRMYLVGTSAVGAFALGAGVHVLVTASELSLGALTAATVILWLASTIHHSMLQGDDDRPSRPAASGRTSMRHGSGV